MSKSNSGNRMKINRRRALLLPAGIGAALALPAEAADSGFWLYATPMRVIRLC